MVDALFFCQFVYLEHVRKSPGRRDFQIPRLIIIWPIGNHGHTILEILEIDGINNVLLAKIGRGRCGTPSASSFTCCFIRGLWQTPLLINQPMGKEHQWMDGICINTLSRLQCSRIGDLICSLKSIFGWSPLAMFVDFPDGNVGVSWMFINFYHVFSFLSWKLPFHQPCQGANLSNFRESKVFFLHRELIIPEVQRESHGLWWFPPTLKPYWCQTDREFSVSWSISWWFSW